MLAPSPTVLSATQDDILSGLVRQNTSVRRFFSERLQASVTKFFEEVYGIGDGAAMCLDTVVLDPAVWPSENVRFHCESELFQLFIAKLMESGHDLDGRSLKGIARLLAVDAAQLQHLIDDEGLEVILSSLDNRVPLELRSQATLATAKYLEAARETGEKRFSALITSKVAKGRNDDLIIAFSAATAVFPVIPKVMTGHFLSEAFMTSLATLISRDMKSRKVEQSTLELLNAACINPACREAISKNLSDWLSHVLTNGTDQSSELAAVILAKIRTSGKNGSSESNGKPAEETEIPELVDRFKGLMSNQKADNNISNAIEGLAYSSVKSGVKEQLAKDPSFLQNMLQTLKSNTTDSSMLYGGLMILVNLAEFLPNMSEEQKKVSQLKAYTSASGKAKAGSDPLNEEDAVMARCSALVDAGVMSLLMECIKTKSPSTLELISKILLSLSRNRASRGVLAQQGAVKLLLGIALPKQDSSGSTHTEMTRNASHALARILISVNPTHVFPSSGFPQVTSAIRPLVSLLSTPEEPTFSADQTRDLLPVFESLLALTNLASFPDAEAAETIVRLAWSAVEDLLLSNNAFIQRAACELVCNLMACESGIIKFSDGTKRAAHRLHILLALTDVDDVATRKAAGGALAMLTEFDAAVAAVLDRPRGVELLLGLCQDEDDGLVHRGVACIRNLTCIASGDIGARSRAAVKGSGGIEKLSNALRKTSNSVILQTGVEALKPLLEQQAG